MDQNRTRHGSAGSIELPGTHGSEVQHAVQTSLKYKKVLRTGKRFWGKELRCLGFPRVQEAQKGGQRRALGRKDKVGLGADRIDTTTKE